MECYNSGHGRRNDKTLGDKVWNHKLQKIEQISRKYFVQFMPLHLNLLLRNLDADFKVKLFELFKKYSVGQAVLTKFHASL